MTKLILFTLLLTACAPIGQPACVSGGNVADRRAEYYTCGKEVASCGLWCTVSEKCRVIEGEMNDQR